MISTASFLRPGFLYLFDINLIDSKNFILSKLNVIRSITKAPEFRKVVLWLCIVQVGQVIILELFAAVLANLKQ